MAEDSAEPTKRAGGPVASSSVPGNLARFETLRSQVHERREYFDKRRQRDKHKSYWLQMAAVALSAAITVLLGLRIGSQQAKDILADVALGFGALLTVLSAADAFYQHRSLWIIRNTAKNRLCRLERRLDYYSAGLDHGAPSDEDLKVFAEEFERVLMDEERAWLDLRGKGPGVEEGDSLRSMTARPRPEDGREQTT
jgi:hypothetical protein